MIYENSSRRTIGNARVRFLKRGLETLRRVQSPCDPPRDLRKKRPLLENKRVCRGSGGDDRKTKGGWTRLTFASGLAAISGLPAAHGPESGGSLRRRLSSARRSDYR